MKLIFTIFVGVLITNVVSLHSQDYGTSGGTYAMIYWLPADQTELENVDSKKIETISTDVIQLSEPVYDSQISLDEAIGSMKYIRAAKEDDMRYVRIKIVYHFINSKKYYPILINSSREVYYKNKVYELQDVLLELHGIPKL